MCRKFLWIGIVFLAFIAVSSHSYADESDAEAGDSARSALPLELTYEQTVTRSHISLGTEVNRLSSSTSSAIGFGPRAGFSYGLSDRWALGATVECLFDMTDSIGAFLYSGLNGAVQYTFLGSSLLSTTRVVDKGMNIVSSVPSIKRRMFAMMGVEQLFLNGTANIYPAVGFFIGAAYTFAYAGQEFQLDTRYTSLQANNNPLSMISVGLSINLTL